MRRVVKGQLIFTVKRWDKTKEYLPVIEDPKTEQLIAPLPTVQMRRLLRQAEEYEARGYEERRVTVERDS